MAAAPQVTDVEVQVNEATRLSPREYNTPRNEAEVRSQVEWVIHSVTQSVNDRTFDAAPGWKYIAEDFLVAPSSQPRVPSNTKAELVAGFKSTAAEHPDFQLGLPQCETEVDMLHGTARVFANAHGIQSSVSRKHTVVFTFKMDSAGHWMACNETTVFAKKEIEDGTIKNCFYLGIAKAPESASYPDIHTRDYFVFGTRRRICSGISLAENSLLLAISRFLWAFDVAPKVDVEGRKILPDQTRSTQGFLCRPDDFGAEITARSGERAGIVRIEWEVAEREFLDCGTQQWIESPS